MALSSLHDIPNGEAGTDRTVAEIWKLVEEALKRPATRILAIQIIDRAGVPTRDRAACAVAIFNWVRSQVRYLSDPVGVDVVQAPEITVKLRAGDCDDHAALVAALCLSIGIQSRLVVVGVSRSTFSHIYSEVLLSGRWIAADTTVAKPFGSAPTGLKKKSIYLEAVSC